MKCDVIETSNYQKNFDFHIETLGLYNSRVSIRPRLSGNLRNLYGNLF